MEIGKVSKRECASDRVSERARENESERQRARESQIARKSESQKSHGELERTR